ncbi:MAG: flagellin, partial [Eubacteriales bacterium]
MQISANKGSYYDGFIQKKELELQKSRMQSKSDDLTRSQEKLSSGSSINRAGDDPAGLAVSEKMRAYITIYDQLDENVSDGQNLVRTAEGALSGVSDMLGRVNELSMQASNGIYSDLERSFMQKELDSIVSEISRVSQSTTFNGINVFSGDSIDLQVGADSTGTVAVPTDGLAAVLDSVKNYDITTASSAMQTVSASRDAINY